MEAIVKSWSKESSEGKYEVTMRLSDYGTYTVLYSAPHFSDVKRCGTEVEKAESEYRYRVELMTLMPTHQIRFQMNPKAALGKRKSEQLFRQWYGGPRRAWHTVGINERGVDRVKGEVWFSFTAQNDSELHCAILATLSLIGYIWDRTKHPAIGYEVISLPSHTSVCKVGIAK